MGKEDWNGNEKINEALSYNMGEGHNSQQSNWHIPHPLILIPQIWNCPAVDVIFIFISTSIQFYQFHISIK